MTHRHINIPEDFTRYPAGRYIADGSFSGQRFRDELLVPALRQADQVEVHLDGALGYGSSFLEEAFGGLIRDAGFEPADLSRRLKIISVDTALVTEIEQYLRISVH